VPVEVQSEDIELNVANLKTSPSVLRPDSEGNKMTLEVVNNGEKSAENVVVELRLPKGFEKTSSFSTRQALGTLDAGEVKKAEFVFDTSENTSSGMRTVPAEIRYSASDNTAEISQDVTFDLHVSGRPQFRVLSSESDLSVGSDGRIEIKVKNFGSVTSDSTRVRVLDNSDLPFSFESSNRFLGTLEPGQSGSVVFETSVEGGATPKEYLLDFEIRGVRDSEVFVEEEVRSVEVDDSSSSRDIPVLPLGAAVILVAAGLSYRFRDRLPI
ncbi:MAG: COG1361 S-layer family protein, partial [Candidatus Nanohaloarchaea archaeon]